MRSDQTLVYGSLSQAREDDVEASIRNALYTRNVSLSHLHLVAFPAKAFERLVAAKDNLCQQIFRLDLSNNHLKSIPSLSFMSGLRELWLSHNPIELLPDVSALKKLEVIDISYTRIQALPSYVSTLVHIFEINWTSTPMEERLRSHYRIAVGDLDTLFEILRQDFDRNILEDELKESIERFYLCKGHANLESATKIAELITHLRQVIPKFEDFKLFIRRAPTLLPDRIEDMSDAFVIKSMSALHQFQRDTKRQRLSADLDISLRNVYFDRIERESVEHVISAIYDKVSLLEDIEFLIKYASQVLPPTPVEALNGNLVWNNIVALQSQLTQKRQVRRIWLSLDSYQES
jgi:Leucine-rich repeat (LRR) protein